MSTNEGQHTVIVDFLLRNPSLLPDSSRAYLAQPEDYGKMALGWDSSRSRLGVGELILADTENNLFTLRNSGDFDWAVVINL